MKSFLVLASFILAASSSFATPLYNSSFLKSARPSVRLGDAAILGQYELLKPTSKSGLNLAQVRINSENKLVVTTDLNDQEYELTGPDKNGVVYDGQDEPNCDGDEQRCLYDSRTIIKLTMENNAAGDVVPHLEIQITETNAFDESGKDEANYTWKLAWLKALPDSVSLFFKTANDAKTQAIYDHCEAVIAPSIGSGISSGFCPTVYSYDLKATVAQSMKAIFHEESAKNVKVISADQLQEQIELAVKLVDKVERSGQRVSVALLQGELRAYADYTLSNYDKIYFQQFADIAVIHASNSKTKTAIKFQFKNKSSSR